MEYAHTLQLVPVPTYRGRTGGVAGEAELAFWSRPERSDQPSNKDGGGEETMQNALALATIIPPGIPKSVCEYKA